MSENTHVSLIAEICKAGARFRPSFSGSDALWARAAFAAPPSHDRSGQRVIPLPFLVLMKLDSARGVDQGDLTRILGLLSQQEVENIVAVVERYYDDPAAATDIRQTAEIGRWEYETTSAAQSDSAAAWDQAHREFERRDVPRDP